MSFHRHAPKALRLLLYALCAMPYALSPHLATRTPLSAMSFFSSASQPPSFPASLSFWLRLAAGIRALNEYVPRQKQEDDKQDSVKHSEAE
jgi:hypothetical protein